MTHINTNKSCTCCTQREAEKLSENKGDELAQNKLQDTLPLEVPRASVEKKKKP